MIAQTASNWQGLRSVFLTNSELKRVNRKPKCTNGFHPDLKSGFHPAVFIQPIKHKTSKALSAMRCKVKSQTQTLAPESRLLLISSLESPVVLPKQVNRIRPKKEDLLTNRKTPSFKDHIIHNGTRYKVLAGENYSIYLSVVHRMIDQLEICQSKWGRVFVVRIELHQKFYTGNNTLLSRFFCNFKKRILKEYGFDDIGYQWAREMETSKAQHYHLAVFLNGYKVKSSWKITNISRDVWEKVKVGNTVPYVKGKVSHDIRKGDDVAKRKAIEHVSYLAKTRGKGYRDPQAKDYNGSRLVKRVRLPSC